MWNGWGFLENNIGRVSTYSKNLLLKEMHYKTNPFKKGQHL